MQGAVGSALSSEIPFTCNVCGARGIFREEHRVNPELPSCECGYNVRLRWIVHRLSRELFGCNLPLSEFTVRREIRGIGLTDPARLAVAFGRSFQYRNTFLDREPRFDVRTDASPIGPLDFLIASEVFEHIEPPVLSAFRNAASLLKDSGILLLTVPWVWEGREPLPELYDWKLHQADGQWVVSNRTRDGRSERFNGLSFDDGAGRSFGSTREHFPELHDWKVHRVGETWELRNTRRDGTVERFENLVFHEGGGLALEMRLFTRRCLEAVLHQAGFESIEFESQEYPDAGIFFPYAWGHPMVARRKS